MKLAPIELRITPINVRNTPSSEVPFLNLDKKKQKIENKILIIKNIKKGIKNSFKLK